MTMTAPSLNHWYALAVTAGRERKVAETIYDRLQRAGLRTADLRIICPDEEVVENAGTSERRIVRKLTLPGYLLIRTRRLSDGAIVTIKRVSGVMGFLGGDETPAPLPQREVDRILGRAEVAGPAGRTRRAPEFSVGQLVTITEGPLSDFTGAVADVNESKETLTVNVEIFGREVPTEVPFRSVRRA